METTIGNRFSIIDPDLEKEIISPAEGESWEKGSLQTIQWKIDSHAERVKISYTTDKNSDGERNWATITLTAPNIGRYVWTVPCDEKPSNDCFIKIEEAAG